MVADLGHSSLNPELSQFIVPKLFWPSSGTFQHHHQLSTSEDTASCLLGRLDTHQRASLCGQLEFVSRISLIGFESRFFQRGASFGSLRGASSELGAAVSIYLRRIACLGKKKSELSQLNDGHYNGARLALYNSALRPEGE